MAFIPLMPSLCHTDTTRGEIFTMDGWNVEALWPESSNGLQPGLAEVLEGLSPPSLKQLLALGWESDIGVFGVYCKVISLSSQKRGNVFRDWCSSMKHRAYTILSRLSVL